VSRRIKGQPFKIKKDFTNLEEDKLVSLQKLSKLFNDYPNLKQEEFFEAPYKVYPDEDIYYPLDFYTRPKAIKCYTQYMKELEMTNPDSEQSLKRLIASLSFVAKYCKEKGIDLDQYESFEEGTLPCFVEHLKHHNINYYTLHALTFRKPAIESRILDFVFPDFYRIFQITRASFYNSSKMKEVSKKAILKITEKLKETKNN
jgi:hypothetical protein